MKETHSSSLITSRGYKINTNPFNTYISKRNTRHSLTMSDRVKKTAEKCASRRKKGIGSKGSETSRKLPPNFYDWKKHFPQLQVLIDNIDVLIKEMKVCSFLFSFFFQIKKTSD